MNNGPQRQIPAQDLKACATCGRNFTNSRLNTHEAICRKSLAACNSRKQFDTSQQRIKGTEMEKLGHSVAKYKNNPCALSTNWRHKHEQLMQIMEDARGRFTKPPKINDLPLPPPKTEEEEYVQCPHCLRKFNQESAQRHIIVCAESMCQKNSKQNIGDTKAETPHALTE